MYSYCTPRSLDHPPPGNASSASAIHLGGGARRDAANEHGRRRHACSCLQNARRDNHGQRVCAGCGVACDRCGERTSKRSSSFERAGTSPRLLPQTVHTCGRRSASSVSIVFTRVHVEHCHFCGTWCVSLSSTAQAAGAYPSGTGVLTWPALLFERVQRLTRRRHIGLDDTACSAAGASKLQRQ